MTAFPVQREPEGPVAENPRGDLRLAFRRSCRYTGTVQVLRESKDEQPDRFESTHWSVVLAAGRGDDAPAQARAALSRLCQTYWTPLYEFARSRGHSQHDAEDLTQGFFVYLIDRQIHARTGPEKGKFRSFLLASLKNYLADAYDRENARKRGGGCEFLPLHEEQAAAEATHAGGGSDADRLFERQWAEALLRTAFDRVANEFSAEGKGALFGALKGFLRGGAEPPPGYDELAARLAMPAPTVRSHVNRLRTRYRAALRAELRRTVGSDDEVDEELRELLRVLTAH